MKRASDEASDRRDRGTVEIECTRVHGWGPVMHSKGVLSTPNESIRVVERRSPGWQSLQITQRAVTQCVGSRASTRLRITVNNP